AAMSFVFQGLQSQRREIELLLILGRYASQGSQIRVPASVIFSLYPTKALAQRCLGVPYRLLGTAAEAQRQRERLRAADTRHLHHIAVLGPLIFFGQGLRTLQLLHAVV